MRQLCDKRWVKWTPNFGPVPKVVNGACSFYEKDEEP
jgi:hypothetical protein